MPESVALRAENEAALAALEKRERGDKLTRAEINAIGRRERRRADESLAAAYERCTTKDLCELLDLKRQQLVRYAKYGAPRNGDGTYNLASFLPWWGAHKEDLVRKVEEKAVDALEAGRRIDVGLKALKFEEEKRLAAPVKHFVQTFYELFGNLKRRAETLPRAHAVNRVEERRWTAAIEEFLAECAVEVRGRVGPPPAPKKKARKKKAKKGKKGKKGKGK